MGLSAQGAGWPLFSGLRRPCRWPGGGLAGGLFAAVLAVLGTSPAVAAGGDDTEREPGIAEAEVIRRIQQAALPLRGTAADYDPLLATIGEVPLVLLGEATHGTAEFYGERARLTRRLVEEKGVAALVLEAGWAPVRAVDAHVRGLGPGNAAKALADFRRFPRWTWRNREFAAIIDDLRKMNAQGRRPSLAVYGMDLYEAPEAIAQVLRYLRQHRPQALRQARRDYACFAPYARLRFDPQLYGRDVAAGRLPSCARRVARQAEGLRRVADEAGDEAGFAAWMSARSVVGAENYYRTLYAQGAVPSWNIRERYLAETIELLRARHGKVVVWAHNTHQGDARATGMLQTGELSLGQLLRERRGEDGVFLIGFSTHAGQVRAARGWGTADGERALLAAQPGSWADLLHRAGAGDFLQIFRGDARLAEALAAARPERAIGVNYFPDAEPRQHYTASQLARRYDALIHIDRTRALSGQP